MEQPKLAVEEPVQPQHSDTTQSSEPQSGPVEETPILSHASLDSGSGGQRAKSLHAHTDSMVTVRLSKAADAEEEDDSSSAPATPTRATPERSTWPQSEVRADADHARPPLSVSTASMSELQRRSGSMSTKEDDEPLSPKGRKSVPSPASATVDPDTTPVGESEETATLSLDTEIAQSRSRSRSISFTSTKSSGSGHVDWERLDKNEEEEEHHEGTDESTAFLLARLEKENNALCADPRAGMANSPRERKGSRPPSIQQIKKMVSEPTPSNLRYSNLPSPPPMTELEFWSALVRNYPQTAQRLPTLTANKIRQGIPPPLRGVVWQSIAGSRDPALEEEYDKLCMESSPYEQLIHKDIGRSFPGVEMFRDPEGEGQQMLSRVLKAYSLYDQDIGYCQGLGFVVGPLLMHMGDKEAFCTLVRLMDHYGLRSCFLPNLAGLHLRVYQFQHFLSQYLPNVTAHLDKLNVEPLYITQWFLSFFGVTCPIPMLTRLYDVILTEGASETLMRVALSVMRRNEKKILATHEFEDVMQLLLSRSLWDPYNYNADVLMADFCHWTGLVTRDTLLELETAFNQTLSPTAAKPSVHTAAQRFLGRLWNSSGALMSPRSPFASSPLAPPPTSNPLRRTPSKQSMASTLNSVDGSESSNVTASTEATNVSRQQSADWAPPKTTVISNPPPGQKAANKDKDLHAQIEELLTALNNLQRENSLLTEQVQREREERDEDRQLVGRIIERLKRETALAAIPEDSENAADDEAPPATPSLEKTVAELEEHFTPATRRTSLMMQTKQQLREESARWKSQYQEEVTRAAELTTQLSDKDRELVTTKEHLKEARSRYQDGHKEKQRLEKANQDLRARKPALDTSKANAASVENAVASPKGLRELKLGRMSTAGGNLQPEFTKRMSSLSSHSIIPDDEQPSVQPTSDDTLLVELANAKTAEAMARQELDEVKAKLESFRKLLGGSAASPSTAGTASTSRFGTSPGHTHSFSTTKVAELKEEKAAAANAGITAAPIAAVGGFFSGWGKRTVSNTG